MRIQAIQVMRKLIKVNGRLIPKHFAMKKYAIVDASNSKDLVDRYAPKKKMVYPSYVKVGLKSTPVISSIPLSA